MTAFIQDKAMVKIGWLRKPKQRLEQPMLLVDLIRHEAIPEDPRHGAEERAGVGAERAGLDQRDARAAAEVACPVDRFVQGCFSKSRWKAEAVGSFWPW